MSDDTPDRAGRREWTGLAVLALPTVLIGLDMTVLHLAAPRLSEELRPSSSQLLWIVDIYGFLVAGFLTTMGTLGDRIGRRRLLLVGAGAFALASLAAAYSVNVGMLIAARALLGIAGATLMPSTLSLISNMFRDPGQRRLAIAVWMTNFSVGGMIGPLVGGALLEHFWYGSVFLLGVPVGVVLLVAGPLLLPEYRTEHSGRLDALSVLLSLCTVLPVVYGFKQLAQEGLHVPPFLAIVAGACFGVLFVRRQLRLKDPVLDLTLFARPTFRMSLGGQTMGLFVLTGTQFLVLQYFQLVLGLPPLEAGLWSLPAMTAGVVGTLLAPGVANRLTPAWVMAGGFALAIPGMLMLTRAGPGTGTGWIAVGFAVPAFGISAALALTNDLIISGAPPERAGNASGVGETGAELGNALGVAVAGSVAAAVYRSQVDAGSLGIGSRLADTADATMGGAVSVAGRLPAELGDRLLEVARHAFADGVRVAAFAEVALLAGLVVMSLTLLRHRERPPDATASDPLARPSLEESVEGRR